MAKRRVFVTYNSVVREVFPRTVIKYTWDNERDQIFKRKKLAVKLLFVNDQSQSISDFTYFSQIELGGNTCAEIKVEIKIKCAGEYINEWDGYFSTGAGRHDFDKCEFEVQPEPDDKYRCILDNWETEFNIFDYGIQQINVRGNANVNYVTLVAFDMQGTSCGKCLRYEEAIVPSYQAYDSGNYSSSLDMRNKGWCVKTKEVQPCGLYTRLKLECADGFCTTPVGFQVGDTLTFLSTCVGTSATICKIQYSTIAEPLPTGFFYVWIRDIINCAPSCCFDQSNVNAMVTVGINFGQTARIREVQTEQFYRVVTTWHAEEYTAPCVGGVCPTLQGNWVLISNDCGGTDNCFFRRCPGSTTLGETKYRGVYYTLMIDDKIKNYCSGIDFMTSIFFNNNPDTADPHYVAGINYITGIASMTENLIVSQRSDIVNPIASNPASIGMVTLKILLDWAREVFNCYWDVIVDTNGNTVLRIEHFDFYEQQFSRDLRDPQYRKYVNHKNSYEHTKEKVPQFEKWKWNESSGIDFVGRDIIYALPCATAGQDVTHSPDQLTTDVSYLFLNPNASLEGFVLLATELIGSDLVLNVEQGLLTGQQFSNAHLSWANLHFNYHRYNRYDKAGTMNDVVTNFFSWRPNIKQVILTIPGCCDLPDPEGYMLTELGEQILDHYRANVDRMELDGKDDMLSLTLSYSI